MKKHWAKELKNLIRIRRVLAEQGWDIERATSEASNAGAMKMRGSARALSRWLSGDYTPPRDSDELGGVVLLVETSIRILGPLEETCPEVDAETARATLVRFAAHALNQGLMPVS